MERTHLWPVANRLNPPPWSREAAADGALNAIKQNKDDGSKVDAVIHEFKRKAREACASPDLSYPDCLRYFAMRLVQDKPGRAAGVIEEAARIYEANGRIEAAANAYRDLANALYDRKMLGWAGDRFHYAAAVYIADGNLGRALEILREAGGKMWNAGNGPWVAWLPEHIALLANDNLTEIAKLEKLQADFEAAKRHSWARSFIEGRRKLDLANPH